MMPVMVFVSLGWMAIFASVGAVAQLDKGTQIISAFAASIMWAVWGASALDVGMTTGAPQPQGVTVVSLNYLGYIFAGLLVVIGIYQSVSAVREQSPDADGIFS